MLSDGAFRGFEVCREGKGAPTGFAPAVGLSVQTPHTGLLCLQRSPDGRVD